MDSTRAGPEPATQIIRPEHIAAFREIEAHLAGSVGPGVDAQVAARRGECVDRDVHINTPGTRKVTEETKTVISKLHYSSEVHILDVNIP